MGKYTQIQKKIPSVRIEANTLVRDGPEILRLTQDRVFARIRRFLFRISARRVDPRSRVAGMHHGFERLGPASGLEGQPPNLLTWRPNMAPKDGGDRMAHEFF